jgi:hypothetical protein
VNRAASYFAIFAKAVCFSPLIYFVLLILGLSDCKCPDLTFDTFAMVLCVRTVPSIVRACDDSEYVSGQSIG